jgi:hypothetical protein
VPPSVSLEPAIGGIVMKRSESMSHARIKATALAAALVIVVALAGPASAAETKHGSCARFGAAFAGWAHSGAGAVGSGMSELARIAPANAAAVIEYEKLVDLLGTGPACDIR